MRMSKKSSRSLEFGLAHKMKGIVLFLSIFIFAMDAKADYASGFTQGLVGGMIIGSSSSENHKKTPPSNFISCLYGFGAKKILDKSTNELIENEKYRKMLGYWVSQCESNDTEGWDGAIVVPEKSYGWVDKLKKMSNYKKLEYKVVAILSDNRILVKYDGIPVSEYYFVLALIILIVGSFVGVILYHLFVL